MRASKGTLFSFIYILALSILWLFYADWEINRFEHLAKGIGSFFGFVGYTLFSLSFLLSSRWKPLENWFGGLDRIYHFHRVVGICGFCFTLFHPLIISLKWLYLSFDKFLWFTLPMHGRTSVNLGSYAYWLMILILGITILKLLPYDKWKKLHKFMTLVFILATFHFLFSHHLFPSYADSKLLLSIPLLVGSFGIIYKQIYIPFFTESPSYKITNFEYITDTVMEIFLRPENKKLSFIPGQYAFFTFQGENLSSESHPFTLCGQPDGTNISILVKNRGDFTNALLRNIKKGYSVFIEGPYGRFDYTKGKKSQIWIAGGIGIVPFIVWAKLLSRQSQIETTLFYCTHRREDAIYLNEFENISKSNPNFRAHYFCSEEKNRINGNKVYEISEGLEAKSIFMCGPKRFTKDLKRQFSKLKVDRRDIHFEDFDFQ
ncbi:MAG: ferric reductase-like transmembrane domain-containing protein [Parachlamydiales bacterium]|nr:ferric reductase-like transmembrane domain-containing protein [Parachlamydiales bacterium]